MKKLGIFAAILTLLLMLCACKGQQPEKPDPDPVPETPVVDPAKEDTHYDFTFDVDIVSDSVSADDGVEIATCEYEIPTITAVDKDGNTYNSDTVPDNAVAQIMKNFDNYYADWHKDKQKWFDELSDMAKEAYDIGDGWFDGMAFSDMVKTDFWHKDNALSVQMLCTSYTGGAHPNGSRETVLFDLTTGQPVELAALTDSLGEFNVAVEDEILRQIEDKDLAGNYFDDYAEMVKNWDKESVAFSEDGMTVTFATYELAPYAEGEQTFTISYDLLKNYFNSYACELLGVE